MSNSAVSPQFNKQRRLLIIISLLISLIYMLDLQIEEIKEITVSQNKVKIGNPQAAILFMWLLWSYFLIRYRAFQMQEQNITFKGLLSSAITSPIFSQIGRFISTENPGKEYMIRAIGFKEKFFLSNVYWFKYEINAQKFEAELRVYFLKIVKLFIKSANVAFVNNSTLTEYFAPYLIALFPLFILMKQHVGWSGIGLGMAVLLLLFLLLVRKIIEKQNIR